MIWLAVFGGAEALVFAVYGRRAYMQRLWNMLIAIDQAGNAYIGGDPDETISSRAARQAHKWGWRLLGRILDAIDPGHMARSVEADEGKNAAWE